MWGAGVKGLIFDLDGTLQDSEQLATEANRMGFRFVLGRDATPTELDQLAGKPVAKVISQIFPEHGQAIFTKAVEHYDACCHTICCYDGVREMLHELSAVGYKLGIASSKRRKYIVKEMEANGILSLFEAIVGQEDTDEHKPSAAPLLLAAEKMGLSPEQCVYIGDLPTDLLAARAAGMTSAAALWGEGRQERLSPCSPDLVFATPHSLLSFFIVQMQEQAIEAAERFAKMVLAHDPTGHDWWHIHRVVRMSERLAREEGADRFICVLAALLHDVADEKLNASKEDGLRKVSDWLDSQSLSTPDARHIMDIISTMSYNAGENPPMRTLEGKVVQDADRLDAIGAIAIARTFLYAGWIGHPIHDPQLPPRDGMTPKEYRQNKSTAINHFHEKLLKLKELVNTPSARQIAEERHRYMEQYVKRFYREWDGQI